ncbi:hypothetical protein PYCCODRAFT_1479977 [Trametes coccinea BRFM310]|uniref:DUF7025 domain-containing protein n=1 Tax=Trametes coccinea (strain BRFM310) TaxID=1353009 RepID=A0A1Y2IDT4_TRAC3|nr:hypothetical protein PYCCODRAFT_1479977 [Trametes coccinea BRFM310]
MRRFISRSRSVPVAAPEWQCPGNLVHSSSMSLASSTSSKSSSEPYISSALEKTLGDVSLDGLPVPTVTPPGREEILPAASRALDCSCSSHKRGRHHTASEAVDSRAASERTQESTTSKARQDCCFEVVNKWTHPAGSMGEPAPRVIIHDPHLLAVCKDLVPDCSTTSSSTMQLELDLDVLLGLLPQLEDCRDSLRDHASRRDIDGKKLQALSALTAYLHKEHQTSLDKLNAHIARGEITFDGLFALFVPRTTVVSKCTTTGEWRAFRVKSAKKVRVSSVDVYHLVTESIDVVDDDPPHCECCSVHGSRPRTCGSIPADTLGLVQSSYLIPRFDGVTAICSLEVFPLQYHPDAERLKTSLIARGNRWLSLRGVRYMHYAGSAAYTLSVESCKTTVKYEVRSPILIDRANFLNFNPNYGTAVVDGETSTRLVRQPISPDELLLAPATVYGFSFADQKWMEFSVEHVLPLQQSGSDHRTFALDCVEEKDVLALGDPRDLASNAEKPEVEATLMPLLDELIKEALTSVKAEAGLHIERLCKEELSIIVASLEERFTRGLSTIDTRCSSEFALHRQLMRIILVVSAILALLVFFLLYRILAPTTRPSRWPGVTHFTIPILSPFASVVEHESSFLNFSQLLGLLLSVGLILALRLWCGGRRK